MTRKSAVFTFLAMSRAAGFSEIWIRVFTMTSSATKSAFFLVSYLLGKTRAGFTQSALSLCVCHCAAFSLYSVTAITWVLSLISVISRATVAVNSSVTWTKFTIQSLSFYCLKLLE